MKITGVECLILDGDYPFVWVRTDEGITGIGECFRRQPGVTKALIEEHPPRPSWGRTRWILVCGSGTFRISSGHSVRERKFSIPNRCECD